MQIVTMNFKKNDIALSETFEIKKGGKKTEGKPGSAQPKKIIPSQPASHLPNRKVNRYHHHQSKTSLLNNKKTACRLRIELTPQLTTKNSGVSGVHAPLDFDHLSPTPTPNRSAPK